MHAIRIKSLIVFCPHAPPRPTLPQIADDMISHRIHQCDTERTGSVMNLVKSKIRTSLSHQMFSDLVFLAINLPFIHECDLELLVRAWCAQGHWLPAAKNEAVAKVLTRMRCETTATFLLKVNGPFPLDRAGDLDFLREEHAVRVAIDREMRLKH